MKTFSKFTSAKKFFPFFILSIIIVLTVHTLIFRQQYLSDMEEMKNNDQEIITLEWDYISTVLHEDYLAAGSQSKVIATKIYDDLIDEYPDKDILASQLENPMAYDNPAFMRIIKDDINNMFLNNVLTDDNDIFVCTRDGVIMDLSLSTAAESFPNNWEKVFSRHYNPTLSKMAIKKMFDEYNGIIFWQSHNPENNHHIISSMTLEELHQFYLTEGVSGLKYVEFLAPAYITDTGDIFGVEDIDNHGIRTKNHKIVVVQTFNLYEQLMDRHSAELERFDSYRKEINKDHRHMITIHVIYVILITGLTILLIYFLMAFNNIVFHSVRKNNNSEFVDDDPEHQV